MKLNEKIAKLRKSYGMSQEELAGKLDVSRQSVFKWESGENTPDLEKIKKIAKLFTVSFDLLLDDEKAIAPVIEETSANRPSQTVSPKPTKYRDVFDSGIKLNAQANADLDNGYIEGKKRIEDYRFTTEKSKHKAAILKHGYSKTTFIQHDLLVDFFLDDVNKSFGFFYDDAEQFVCPFENFVNMTISNSGMKNDYTHTPVVGVGFGKNPSIAVGSMPLSQTNLPLRYDIVISYFDQQGYLKDYKISFSCIRYYVFYNGLVDSVDSLYLWQNALSQETDRKLHEIQSNLEGVKEIGKQILNGLATVRNLDFSMSAKYVKDGQSNRIRIRSTYSREVQLAQAKKKKGWIIFAIILGALCAMCIATCSINNAVKENRIAQVNRKKADTVVQMIDNLGEVTLSFGPELNRIESEYNALTDDQKKLVTNYSAYLEAKKKYEKIQYDKLEEETKDDPTRTIVLSDLNGRWKSSTNEWSIADLSGGKSVLFWTSNSFSASFISGTLGSSSLTGYNHNTRRMEAKLYHYYGFGAEYLDITLTKSSFDSLTMYFENQTFIKSEAW